MEEENITTEGEPYPVSGYLSKHSGFRVAPLGMVINGGDMPNMKPEQGAIKPHECHHYSNSQLATVYQPGATHMSFHMTGSYPVALEINHGSGTISGQVKMWNNQPIINCNKPELMKLNGGNWMNTGRPKDKTWTFNFTVYAVYNYVPPDPTKAVYPPGVYKTSLVNCSITTIRNHSIDTLIFGLCYMATGETPFSVNSKTGNPGEKELFIVKHNLNIYGEPYELDKIDNWVGTHNGPFPQCERVLEYFKKLMGVG